MGVPEMVIGADFSGASNAATQRRKLIAIAALRHAPGTYEVTADRFNARLVGQGQPPGWTAEELAGELRDRSLPRVAAFDFPFSIPRALLEDADFAAAAGHPQAFGTWEAFNRFIAANLPLRPPLDLARFAPWRNVAYWQKRASDGLAQAQPPLKSMYQVLFNMTLLGNALLAALAAGGKYRIVPFHASGPANEVIEIYPGAAMRSLGLPTYKRDPRAAIRLMLDYCASKGIAITIDPAIRTFCETYNSGKEEAPDPDGSDAFIALATAILYREGIATEIIAHGATAERRTEGVIWGTGLPLSVRRTRTRPRITGVAATAAQPAAETNDGDQEDAVRRDRRTGMRDESRAFLFRLLEAAGPSNYEVEAARVWRAEAAHFCAEVTADVNGNAIARLRSDAAAGAKKVVLCGHIDEIGLIVTHINDDGTLAFRGIGGWDPQVLVGQRVRILARGGNVIGVIGRKAIHLLRGDERDRAVKLEDLWIDLGAGKKEDTAKRVRVGDPAVIDASPIMLSDDLIASRALDDRCCAYIALETLRLLSEGEPPWCDVYAAATVQEEITFRGAHTVAATLAPDVAIALDVTHSTDRPGVSPQDVGAHACGSGATINRGSVSNEPLVDLLIATAEREGLPYTLEAGGRSTGTDADALVVTGKGTAGGVISVPCRYMHSPVEVVSLTDLETCAKLLAATIRAIGPETDFIPR